MIVRMPEHIAELAMAGWDSYLPLSDALEEIGLIHWANHIRMHASRPGGGKLCSFIEKDGGWRFGFGSPHDDELLEYARNTRQL